MKATDWEFRHRSLLFGLIFGLTFPLYALDRHNAGVAIAHWLGPALRMDTHLVSRFVFGIGAAWLATAAFLRTWASSYLGGEVVYAAGVRTESLVADGPYRRVRNPLYLGNALIAAGLGVMMNRIGFPLAMLATVVFCYRLILREEAEFDAIQGKPYLAYRRSVPRLWPSLWPRIPSAGGRPRWAEGFKAESWCWGFAAAVLAFAATLSLAAFYAILAASVVWLWISAAIRGGAGEAN
ncbi:MAG: isoprenylcysteine carboxylmethyltransferase family protein [Acidobacteria bacterium]|nr:isoprenylcysteine carboxylmethyltransferase family protein [Acidobacteriota bacterium]